ncbi:toxin CcdB [Azospirillum rugosum]|uniref:Toxin CcdB n=1 Tax=Azospirillum rugosum TaxID=416170 RepID=A0ABS4SH47_9PROT|nr:CcdB family protein [Azospirillum rugosum]MBP2291901.1 toxin CcdB [Azospirillum rugosum]MDQ0530895.1 toxin CcdB [Azospirillum rugosum]
MVAVLQADIADTGAERMIAPLARAQEVPGIAGRLAPVLRVGDTDYVLAVPRMTTIPTRLLGEPVASIAAHRDTITAALDYLFQGI